MSENTGSVVVKVGAKEVIVRELCVREIRELIADEGGGDLVTGMLFTDMRLTDIPVFTSLTSEEVGEMTPTDLDQLRAKCKEKNRHFFEMLGRLVSLQNRPSAT